MGNDKANIMIAVVSDMLPLFSNTANATLQAIINKKAEEARDILFEEIKSGNFDNIDKDEFVFINYRYLRAAIEGTARLNLRLLAKVIKNQVINSCLKADEFLYYADLISSLRREEIILLGTYYKNWMNLKGDNGQVKKSAENTQENLIPRIFTNKKDFKATLFSLSRTGFIFQTDNLFDIGFFHLSTLGEKICEMAEFEKAIEEEGKK